MNKEKLLGILEQFCLAGHVQEIVPYGNGHINDTYKVLNEEGDTRKTYILQRMNKAVFKNCEELMENVRMVTDFLKEKIREQGGDPERETMQIIPGKDGQPFVRDEKGDAWRVYSFIEDTESFDRAESPEQFGKSGYAFGNFQYLLVDFPASKLHETIKDFHNTADRFSQFVKSVEADVMGRAGEVREEIDFILQRESDCHFFNDLLVKKELPLRVTHNDTKLNNVLFSVKTGEAVCVVDLDTVMPGLSAHDFGDAIRFGASTAAEDEQDLSKVSCSMELYGAYLDGYLQGCKGSLTAKEIETLPMGAKVITLEQGMRFLTDYLEGDVYFKTHREGHNLDRCRTQLKLVSDMENKWETMNDMVKKYLVDR